MKHHAKSMHRTLLPLLLIMTILAACQLSETFTATSNQTEAPTLTPTPDQSAIVAAWEKSGHAHTYGLEKGPNTYCAKCHSPQNWDPAASIDSPPNCVSCKFSNEPEMRIAVDNPPVDEADWKNIGCAVCHRVDNGVAEAEVSWLDVRTGYYETVATATELCEKCHLDNDTLSHKVDYSDSPHEDFTCTQCHDAHSTAASCTAGGCHTDFSDKEPKVIAEHLDQVNTNQCKTCHKSVADIHMNFLDEPPTKCMDCHGHLMGETGEQYQLAHSANHANVWCVACHDATGLEVGPDENLNEWVTYRSIELLGQITTGPYRSHKVQLEVDCSRCHFAGNSWGLSVIEGEAVEPAETVEPDG